MSNPQEYPKGATPKIQALPGLTEPGTPSPEILIRTDPAAGPYPDIAPAEEPVEVCAHALGASGTEEIDAAIHWRKTLDAKWHVSQMQPEGSMRWKGRWIPPTAGDYQWMVKLHAGKKQSTPLNPSPGSSVRLLRAERRELTRSECFRAAREPLPELVARAHSSDAGIFMLPALFPQAANSLVGSHAGGHYTISKELGNAFSFGELAATINRQGKILGLTIPVNCSPEHPFRVREPGAFHTEGTPCLDGKNWRRHLANWEAIFRYWIVQGIDIFEVSDPGEFSPPFWQELIRSIRDDFPGTAFTTRDNPGPDLWPHLLGIGFSQLSPPASTAPGSSSNGIPPSSPDTTGEMACTSSNPLLITSIRENADGESLLRVSNDNPSSTQSGHIHLSGIIPVLKESERYHMHNLTNGRSCHWIGTTNFVSMKAGEPARTLRIERNH